MEDRFTYGDHGLGGGRGRDLPSWRATANDGERRGGSPRQRRSGVDLGKHLMDDTVSYGDHRHGRGRDRGLPSCIATANDGECRGGSPRQRQSGVDLGKILMEDTVPYGDHRHGRGWGRGLPSCISTANDGQRLATVEDGDVALRLLVEDCDGRNRGRALPSSNLAERMVRAEALRLSSDIFRLRVKDGRGKGRAGEELASGGEERGRGRWRDALKPSVDLDKAVQRSTSLTPTASRIAREVRRQRVSSVPPARKMSLLDFLESTRVTVAWEALPGDLLRNICSHLSCCGELLTIYSTCRLWRIHVMSVGDGFTHRLSIGPPLCMSLPSTARDQCSLWDPCGRERLFFVPCKTPLKTWKIIGISHGCMLLAEGGICELVNPMSGQCARRLRMPVSCPQKAVLSAPVVDEDCYILAVTSAHVIAKRVNGSSAWSIARLHESKVNHMAFVESSVCYLLGVACLQKVVLHPYLQCSEVRVLMPVAWKDANKGRLWLTQIDSELICIQLRREGYHTITPKAYILTKDLINDEWILWKPVPSLNNSDLFLSTFGGTNQSFCVKAIDWGLAENEIYYPNELDNNRRILRIGESYRIQPGQKNKHIKGFWIHPDVSATDDQLQNELKKLEKMGKRGSGTIY